MAYDEGLAEILRGDLAGFGTVAERRMFGGLCFMLDGHMICGVMAGGGLFRVGPARMDAALAVPGSEPMKMGNRIMRGYVVAGDAAMADDAARACLLDMARDCHAALPPR